MGECVIERCPPRNLEPRLARRRAIEAMHHKGKRAHGHGDYLLRHDRIAGPVLKAALVTTGLYSKGAQNAFGPVVRDVRLEFGDLPYAFNGFRILHLSDLHIDGMDGLAETTAELLAHLSVDLCVITGDYRYEVAGPCDGVYPRMRTILGSIRARHGVMGILGNHDTAEVALGLEDLGARMLINEAAEVRLRDGALWVIGVDDPHYYGCDDLAGARTGVPKEAFQILLVHTPELYREAAAAGVALYLCGHTHGGQICLPGAQPLLFNAACPRSYARGTWRHDRMRGYTNSGLGCSMLPVRYNCPPEIAVIELARSASPIHASTAAGLQIRNPSPGSHRA